MEGYNAHGAEKRSDGGCNHQGTTHGARRRSKALDGDRSGQSAAAWLRLAEDQVCAGSCLHIYVRVSQCKAPLPICPICSGRKLQGWYGPTRPTSAYSSERFRMPGYRGQSKRAKETQINRLLP